MVPLVSIYGHNRFYEKVPQHLKYHIVTAGVHPLNTSRLAYYIKGNSENNILPVFSPNLLPDYRSIKHHIKLQMQLPVK